MPNNTYAGFISTETGSARFAWRGHYSTRVETSGGNTLIITKARFFGIFTRPETHVIPEGFGSLFGFQVRYNTCDPQILAGLHVFWVKQIKQGEFQTLLTDAKWGRVLLFLREFESLEKYIVRLSA